MSLQIDKRGARLDANVTEVDLPTGCPSPVTCTRNA